MKILVRLTNDETNNPQRPTFDQCISQLVEIAESGASETAAFDRVDSIVDAYLGSFKDPSDPGLDICAFGHIGRVVERLDAEFLLDLDPLGLDYGLIAKPVDDDVCAFLGERAGDGQADAARRTGDEGVALGERHWASPFRHRDRSPRYSRHSIANAKYASPPEAVIS
jgi:hypothetical protein